MTTITSRASGDAKNGHPRALVPSYVYNSLVSWTHSLSNSNCCTFIHETRNTKRNILMITNYMIFLELSQKGMRIILVSIKLRTLVFLVKLLIFQGSNCCVWQTEPQALSNKKPKQLFILGKNTRVLWTIRQDKAEKTSPELFRQGPKTNNCRPVPK